MATAAQAAPVLVDIPIASTGDGSNGRDSNYIYDYEGVNFDPSINPGTLTNGSGGAAPAYIMNANAWPVTNSSGYYKMPDANWIGPTPSYYTESNGGQYLTAATGYYVYQTSFNIDAGSTQSTLNSVLIAGDIASDNCTVGIAINGTLVSTSLGSIMTPGTCLSQNHTFAIGGSSAALAMNTSSYTAITSALHSGQNTIQFVVYNSGTAQPNPTGLVAWVQADDWGVPEASTSSLLVIGLASMAWLRRRSLRPAA
jgi:hypothetical protein